jgi:hypothetical protein
VAILDNQIEGLKMINKCVYLIFGIAALVGAYAYFTQAVDSGFCTDTSILTMELPGKEDGYLAKPTFSLETQLPTIPETIGFTGWLAQ